MKKPIRILLSIAAFLVILNFVVYFMPALFPPAVRVAYAQAAVFDPCAWNGSVKSTAFANITSATTTQLVALTSGKQIFVCGYNFDISSTTASTVYLEYGTSATCAAGPVALTSTYTNSTLVNAYKLYGGGLMSVITVPASDPLCAVSTVGTGPTIGVTVTYVVQ